MKKDEITKAEIDQVLFKFLQSIYCFERREVALFKLTWDEVYLLQLLIRKPGLPVTEAARNLKVPDFVASRMITKLCKEGLLKRQKAQIDKRVVNVFITDTGIKTIQDIEQYNYEIISTNFNKASEEEIRILMKSIERLGEFLGLE